MKKFILIITLSLTFIFIFFINSSAQNNKDVKEKKVNLDLYELSLEELGKVVITSSKTPQFTTKITQKVDVITDRQINNSISSNRNLAELIRYLPGASVMVLSRNDANWGAYGGIGPKYCTYMINGLVMDGFIDPMSINKMAIQRIEIQRGPASILYPNYLSQDFAGNQSPLAGTINLILKDDINKPFTTIEFNYGSYNTYNVNAYHENNIGGLSIITGVNYEKSDYINYGSENSWLNMLKNPEYQKVKCFIKGSIYLDESKKHEITIFGNQTFHSGDVGRINRQFNNRYSLINFSYSGQIANTIKITAKSGIRVYNRRWQEDNYSSTVNDISLKEIDGVKQFIIPADVSISYLHFNNSNLTMGVDFQNAAYQTTAQPVNNNNGIMNDASASQIGAYLQEELQLDKFTLRGSGRFNHIGYDINKLSGQSPGTENQAWNVFLYSMGAKFRFIENWTIFSNAGNSFMSPALKSIGGTIHANDTVNNGQLPNPNLKPESGLSFDFGIDGELPLDISLSIRAFFSTISDAIIDNVIRQIPSQTISVNAEGKTKAYGIELGIKQIITDNIDWFINTTVTKSEIIDPNNPDQNGVEVPFVPAFVFNLGCQYRLPFDIEIIPTLHYASRIFDNNSKQSRNSFLTKELLNLLLNKNIAIIDKYKLSLTLKFYNITNNKFNMPWQFRDPGFSMTAGLGLSF